MRGEPVDAVVSLWTAGEPVDAAGEPVDAAVSLWDRG
jgi:hypothetical protein